MSGCEHRKASCALLPAMLKYCIYQIGYRLSMIRIRGNRKENMMLFVEYPKCTTCKKAKKWLEENGFSFDDRNIKEENPTKEELESWIVKSGLPVRKFFNTSGMLYKEMELKNKLPNMKEGEQIALLATDGMLVKRPIVVTEDTVLVGFKEQEWSAKLK